VLTVYLKSVLKYILAKYKWRDKDARYTSIKILLLQSYIKIFAITFLPKLFYAKHIIRLMTD